MPPTVNSDQKYCLYKSFEVSKVKKLSLKKKKKKWISEIKLTQAKTNLTLNLIEIDRARRIEELEKMKAGDNEMVSRDVLVEELKKRRR